MILKKVVELLTIIPAIPPSFLSPPWKRLEPIQIDSPTADYMTTCVFASPKNTQCL